MRLKPRTARPRRIAAAVVSLGLGGVAIVALVADASAHASIVSGSVTCTNSTYSITWTVQNDWNLVETVTLVADTGGGTVNGLPTSVAASGNGKGGSGTQPYKASTFTQTGILSTSATASVTVKGSWSDKATTTNSGTVQLRGQCGGGGQTSSPSAGGSSSSSPSAGGSSSSSPPQDAPNLPVLVTPAPLGITQASCTSGTPTAAFVTIPALIGIRYLTGGTTLPAGNTTVPEGTSVTVTAVAEAGFNLGAGSVTSWTFTANAAPTCVSIAPQVLGVTFVAPVVKSTAAALPFTGMPLLPTTLVGLGFVLAGGLLVGSARRHSKAVSGGFHRA